MVGGLPGQGGQGTPLVPLTPPTDPTEASGPPKTAGNKTIADTKGSYNDGVGGEQQSIGLIKINDPKLFQGNPIGGSAGDVKAEINGNAWLRPSPNVAFTTTFLELSSQLRDMKLDQAEMVKLVLASWNNLSKDEQHLIQEIAKWEMAMNIAGAVAGAVTVATSAGGVAHAEKMRTSTNADGTQKYGEGQILATATMWQQGGQAIGSMGEKAADAALVVEKGKDEAAKTSIDFMNKLSQKNLEERTETMKQCQEMGDQLLQNLNKMIDAEYKAHEFRG